MSPQLQVHLLYLLCCRACPLNQITSSDATSYPNSASHYVNNNGAGGFTSEAACVNQDGYGVAMRVSSPCAEGFYNARDTRGPCRQCPPGTTTKGVGLGKTLADCGLMPGFGFWEGAIRPCPPGGVCGLICAHRVVKTWLWGR